VELPDDDPRWSWELAGGALMDMGCYSLHSVRTMAPWAGGEPPVVAARGTERAGRPGVDERLEADLEYPGGATALAHCDMAAPHWRITCRVIGDRYQLEALRAHLRAGAPLPIDGHDAVATAELVDATYAAAGFAPRPRHPATG
jgi:predicted dehydrogenase